MTGRVRPREPRPQYDQGCGARIPDKVEGRHRWVMGIMYTISETQASATRTGARVNCDHENRVSIDLGCWDCHLPYDQCFTDLCQAPATPD